MKSRTPLKLRDERAKVPIWARSFVEEIMAQPSLLIDEEFVSDWFFHARALGVETGMDLMLKNRRKPG